MAHHAAMGVTFARGLSELDPRVEGFLAERIEDNVAASLLVHSRAGRLPGEQPLFAWSERGDGSLAYFAMRTPPWPLLVAGLGESDAADLMERWLAEDPELPGVSAPPSPARAVARAWERRTGGRVHCRMAQAMHVLEEVIDPPSWPSGGLRRAGEADRELLIEWERGFVADARANPGARNEAERSIARRLAAGGQFLWEDGTPVSTVALSPNIAGTVRIGPVYTPRQYRGRGYASAAVARACHDALAGGARRCMLYTDLSNPTSNKIYAAVGFRRFGDWEELEFGL